MQELTLEQRLLILTSRLTLKNEEIEEIKNITKHSINWFEFTKYAMYHKTFNLCWSNILKTDPDTIVPKYLNENYFILYKGFEQRNRLFFAELDKVKQALADRGVTCLPVKGAMLIPSMYKDYGIRFMGDMDCLIKHEDIKALEKVMYELGYVYGKYNPQKQMIEKVDRVEQIKWKAYMTNLFPFQRIDENDKTIAYKLDFRFCLDDRLSYEPINQIIDEYKLSGEINAGHILMHLCAHFYSEAKHTASIYVSKDFNIIKLCDIREYILVNKNSDMFEVAIQFAKIYSLEKCIYFTLYCLQMIYNDGYEDQLMKQFELNDVSFLNTYGISTNNENKVFENSFWERIFECNNATEIKDKPSLFPE